MSMHWGVPLNSSVPNVEEMLLSMSMVLEPPARFSAMLGVQCKVEVGVNSI